MRPTEQNEEYTAPEVTKYGNVRALTRANSLEQRTDVPLGTPADNLNDITSG